MTMLLVSMAVGLGAPAPVTARDMVPAHTICAQVKVLDTYSGLWHAVRRQYLHSDPGAQGRNIRRWGLRNGAPSRCRHLIKSIGTLRVLHMSAAARRFTYAGPPSQAPSGASTLYAGGALEAIAQCESGGDIHAVNPNGHYGKFQFDQQTWDSVGGTGRPDQASEQEQNKRAGILYSERGGSPWACKP